MTSRSDGRPLIDRPARVVHVIPALKTGGAEQQLLALAKSLDRSKWESTVICSHFLGALGSDYIEASVPVITIGKSGVFDPSLLFRLATTVRQIDPDIIHTWLFSGNFWGRAAVPFLYRRPVIIATVRTIEVDHPIVYQIIDRVLARYTDMIIGNSARVSRFLVDERAIPKDKVVTIYNGIILDRAQKCIMWADEKRNEFRSECGLPDNAFIVGHIAQPVREKRFDILVQVIKKCIDTGIPIHVLQLGRDPESQAEAKCFREYKESMDHAGVRDRIHRVGFVRDISPYLAIVDAVVQTSDIEGFPNAMIEALAMERPVVATDAGGTADVVRNWETGFLVPTGDAESIVRRLVWIFNHKDEARSYGRAGRRLVERYFTVSSLVKDTTSVYERLLHDRGLVSRASERCASY